MLSRKIGLSRRGALKQNPAKHLKRTPLARLSKINLASPIIKKCEGVKAKRKKSSGLKGIAVTAEEKTFHNRMALLGCIACLQEQRPSPPVSIHHCKGRSKKGAHLWVLPLCAGHHQDGTGILGLIARHPWKARFEAAYGSECELLVLCLLRIVAEDGNDHALPKALRRFVIDNENADPSNTLDDLRYLSTRLNAAIAQPTTKKENT